MSTLPNLDLFPTEAINPNTTEIDNLSSLEVARLINQEDHKVALAVEKALPQIATVIDVIATAFKNGHRLFYTGAGTSGRLGVLDASECPPTFGAPKDWVQGIIAGGEIALRNAVEGAEDNLEQGEQDIINADIQAGDVVVGLSASGHAPYVHGSLIQAKKLGAYTACVTCHPQSKLIQLCDQGIVVEVGAEVLTGSTRMKAGTAQKLVLNMLTTGAMIQIGKTYGNLMVDVQPTNSKLKARAIRLVKLLCAQNGKTVDDQSAETVLNNTQFQVKPAILMLLQNCSLKDANQRLEEFNGKLRLALT